MSTKSTTALDQKLYADLQLTDEVLGNDYAADGETVVGTCRIPLEDLLRRGIVPLDAPIATVNTANTVSVAGPILGFTNDSQLVVRFSTTAGTNGWVSITGGLFTGDNISELINDSGFQDAADVSASITTAINNLLAGAPGALDTLNELSAALGDDPDFAGTITAALSGKEPTQTPASQIEAEAGTEVALRSWSPLRVKQAVDSIGAAFVTTAQSAATAASNSETAAAASEAAAASSASAASTSETNAGNSASAAATSETNAGNSASAAATSETNAGSSASAASTSESNAAASETAAEAAQSYAEEWANKAEDSLVSAAAGGDEVDDYSALHHAAKAADSASAAAGSAAVAASISGPVANPKAFAGGVAFDGGTGTFAITDHPVFDETTSFSICGVFSLQDKSLGLALFRNGGSLPNFQLQNYFGIELRWRISTSTGNANATNTETDALANNTHYHIVAVYDADEQEIVMHVNGVAGTPVSTSSIGSFTFVSGTHFASVSGVTGFNKQTTGDVAIFNRAISSTEAAILYNQGIQGWLAANPENKWGKITPSFTDSLDALSNDSGGVPVALNTVDQDEGTGCWEFTGLGVSASFNSSVLRIAAFPNSFAVGDLYRVELRAKRTNGDASSVLSIREYAQSSGEISHTSSGTAWETVAGVITIQAATKTGTGRSVAFSATSGVEWLIDNLRLTKLGCLACLPMDEGIGYQLRDLSDNHFDALLSTTGFEHLKPKSEGFIRDFNVDAYNGGAGDVELISSSRDVLPIGAIITSAQARNNAAGTVGAGLLDLKRSDRTTRNTIGDNAVDIETTRFGLLSTDEASQIHNDLNVAIDASGDSDATDLDVRVDYELID